MVVGDEFAFNFDCETRHIAPKSFRGFVFRRIAVTNLLWNLVQTPERSTECLHAEIELNFLKLGGSRTGPNHIARTVTKKYKITRRYCLHKPFSNKFMHPSECSINKYRLHGPFEKLPVDFEHKRYNLPHWCKITVHFFCVIIFVRPSE